MGLSSNLFIYIESCEGDRPVWESINFRQKGASVYEALPKATAINKEESIMLDLTFGEQVKLVLSRKGMTIKELAEIIEKRTGKKMSRQNLTQRLGRDNFQEQDMRMIAEILECPFRLSILADNETAEEVKTQDEAKENTPSKPASKVTKESVRIAKAKARREKKAREAERLADAIEQVPSEMRREPVEKEMTLGDYIDIHEELVRQETARLPKVSAEEEALEAETSESGISDADKAETMEAIAVKEEDKASADEVQEEGASWEEAEQEGTEAGAAQVEQEAGEAGQEEDVQEERLPEETEEIDEELKEYVQPEVDVEELLREMEELEKERRLLEQQVKEAKEAKEAREQEEQLHEEKKVTGWRAVFQRRTKKERQEELQEEARMVEQVIPREPTMEELEDDYDDYIEYDEPEEESEEQLELQEVDEEQPAPEELLEELIEEDEDAEDLTRGELNPYTGHEYETNSVRMHPKRIGYVQLYDRRDHGWTDMTEWAFLGYQERKKALLGKDYDPPIYLD